MTIAVVTPRDPDPRCMACHCGAGELVRVRARRSWTSRNFDGRIIVYLGHRDIRAMAASILGDRDFTLHLGRLPWFLSVWGDEITPISWELSE